MSTERTFIFGPVPSRRLGRSLGVDLTPTKTCTYNCLYCQLAETRFQTVERSRFCDPQKVLEELHLVLEEIDAPDWITFSGTGEPTLHADLGYLLREIKALQVAPICVITNGSLLWREDVQTDLALADRVLPTLVSVRQDTFVRIHRPLAAEDLNRILEGLRSFCRRVPGIVELEIFVCPGLNDQAEELHEIVDFVSSCEGLRGIYLNTSVRAALDSNLVAAPPEVLQGIKALFPADLPVSTAYDLKPFTKPSNWKRSADEADVLKLLLRHPCSQEQIQSVLEIPTERLRSLLEGLTVSGRIKLGSDGCWSLCSD